MDRAIMCVRDGKLISDDLNYQGFVYDAMANVCIPTNDKAIAKWDAVSAVFPDLVRGRTFMDVGASTGLFCFKALEHGATKAIAVEHKAKRSVPMRAILKKYKIPKLKWVHGAWPKVKHTADVTMFLSILHHICVQHHNTLEVVLRDINRCTKHAAIVEWVGRDDVGVVNRKPSDWYRQTHFEEIAKTWFVLETIGKGHRDTRLIYLLRRR